MTAIPLNDSTAAAPPLATGVTRLAQMGAIMVTGQDARGYLQGQVTSDLDTLTPERVQLACCNSPQGRAQAVFWMIQRADGIALILPASMLEGTVTRLRKYVMRAKAKIEPASQLQIGFVERASLPGEVTLPDSLAHREVAGVSYFRLPGHEDAMVLGANLAAEVDGEQRWKLAHIRAGLPQVYSETHEAFVAQMLNLDLLSGISFEKGCYTGQEIIARAHFRGAVKRRMFRFSATGSPPLPGTRVLSGEQHAGEVVDAVATDNGCELLAVISLAQAGNELRLDGQTSTLQRLELPYSVPAG